MKKPDINIMVQLTSLDNMIVRTIVVTPKGLIKLGKDQNKKGFKAFNIRIVRQTFEKVTDYSREEYNAFLNKIGYKSKDLIANQ
jgi:hypothetical protein